MSELESRGQLEVIEPDGGHMDMPPVSAGVGPAEVQGIAYLARMNPRNEKRALSDALAVLENNPDFCDPSANKSATYAVPRAGKTIRGVGIHGARVLATCYRNNLTARLALEQGEGKRFVRGIYIDGQNGIIRVADRLVPTHEKRKKQGMVRLNTEEYDQKTRAEMSKAERDAILMGLPPYLVDQFFDKARLLETKLAEKSGKTPKERWQSCLEHLSKWKITEQQALELLGLDSAEQLTHERATHMAQIVRGINEGESTVAEVFGKGTPDEKPVEGLPGAVASEQGKPVQPQGKPAPTQPEQAEAPTAAPKGSSEPPHPADAPAWSLMG